MGVRHIPTPRSDHWPVSARIKRLHADEGGGTRRFIYEGAWQREDNYYAAVENGWVHTTTRVVSFPQRIWPLFLSHIIGQCTFFILIRSLIVGTASKDTRMYDKSSLDDTVHTREDELLYCLTCLDIATNDTNAGNNHTTITPRCTTSHKANSQTSLCLSNILTIRRRPSSRTRVLCRFIF